MVRCSYKRRDPPRHEQPAAVSVLISHFSLHRTPLGNRYSYFRTLQRASTTVTVRSSNKYLRRCCQPVPETGSSRPLAAAALAIPDLAAFIFSAYCTALAPGQHLNPVRTRCWRSLRRTRWTKAARLCQYAERLLLCSAHRPTLARIEAPPEGAAKFPYASQTYSL
jgi:hypothetical protein